MGYQCQPETSSYSIKAKPNGAILSAIDVNTTLASNYRVITRFALLYK